jgi:hypothetical protein
MGFGRKIWRSGAGIALLLSAMAAAAEPAEPLTVTKLGDPQRELLISSASDNIGTPDGDTDEFSRAISGGVREQQQSTEAQCQATNRATGSIAARWAWEARCRYRRY